VKLTVNDADGEVDGLLATSPLLSVRRDAEPRGRDPWMDMDRDPVAELVAGVAAAMTRRAAAVEYARRLAQRGTPLTALLRAYRVGHACFSSWLLRELALQADDAQMITAATLGMSEIVAGYIDQTSEKMVAAYTGERENWLRNRSAARAARVRDLLSGERADVRAAEAILAYRLRQYHVGVVCWTGDAAGTADEITRLERAISRVAAQAACSGDPLFLPRDESSAWAWLPFGIRDQFDSASASTRRAPCSPARHTAGLPARWGQLQDDRRTVDAAQEHRPVSDPQGAGESRPAGGR
jgi:hypothetical protein